MNKIVYKEGDIVGDLIFVRDIDRNQPRKAVFKCRCGKELSIFIKDAKSKNTKSCGCIINHDKKKHGMSNSVEYRTWRHMLNRCYNPSTERYSTYGGRGIEVCQRWRYSFSNFYEDMGLRPTANHSIDRINNNGNYEPLNCKWSVPKEQSLNRRTTILVSGHSLRECCRILGVNYKYTHWKVKCGKISLSDINNEMIKVLKPTT